MKSADSIAPATDHAQVAALPLQRGPDGALRVLLLTSRENGRWIIPKGWPMHGRRSHEAAAREAIEEAGVVGEVKKKSIGSYHYFKRRAGHFDYCRVDVYPLWVDRQLDSWREQGQRKTRWLSLAEASMLVEEPGLAALLQNLATQSAETLRRGLGPKRRRRAGRAPRRKAGRKGR